MDAMAAILKYAFDFTCGALAREAWQIKLKFGVEHWYILYIRGAGHSVQMVTSQQ